MLPEQEIKMIMNNHMKDLIEGGYTSSQVLNMDETGINKAIGPTHIYIPIDGGRGEQPGGDVKARITGVITVAANGLFLPNKFIFKHSKSEIVQ